MMPEEIVEAEITPDSKPEPNNVIRPPVLTCAGYCHGFLRLCYVMLALLLLLTRLLVPPDVALSPYTISHYIAAVCAYCRHVVECLSSIIIFVDGISTFGRDLHTKGSSSIRQFFAVPSWLLVSSLVVMVSSSYSCYLYRHLLLWSDVAATIYPYLPAVMFILGILLILFDHVPGFSKLPWYIGRRSLNKRTSLLQNRRQEDERHTVRWHHTMEASVLFVNLIFIIGLTVTGVTFSVLGRHQTSCLVWRQHFCDASQVFLAFILISYLGHKVRLQERRQVPWLIYFCCAYLMCDVCSTIHRVFFNYILKYSLYSVAATLLLIAFFVRLFTSRKHLSPIHQALAYLKTRDFMFGFLQRAALLCSFISLILVVLSATIPWFHYTHNYTQDIENLLDSVDETNSYASDGAQEMKTFISYGLSYEPLASCSAFKVSLFAAIAGSGAPGLGPALLRINLSLLRKAKFYYSTAIKCGKYLQHVTDMRDTSYNFLQLFTDHNQGPIRVSHYLALFLLPTVMTCVSAVYLSFWVRAAKASNSTSMKKRKMSILSAASIYFMVNLFALAVMVLCKMELSAYSKASTITTPVTLRGDWGYYLAISAMVCSTVASIVGVLVASLLVKWSPALPTKKRQAPREPPNTGASVLNTTESNTSTSEHQQIGCRRFQPKSPDIVHEGEQQRDQDPLRHLRKQLAVGNAIPRRGWMLPIGLSSTALLLAAYSLSLSWVTISIKLAPDYAVQASYLSRSASFLQTIQHDLQADQEYCDLFPVKLSRYIPNLISTDFINIVNITATRLSNISNELYKQDLELTTKILLLFPTVLILLLMIFGLASSYRKTWLFYFPAQDIMTIAVWFLCLSLLFTLGFIPCLQHNLRSINFIVHSLDVTASSGLLLFLGSQVVLISGWLSLQVDTTLPTAMLYPSTQ